MAVGVGAALLAAGRGRPPGVRRAGCGPRVCDGGDRPRRPAGAHFRDRQPRADQRGGGRLRTVGPGRGRARRRQRSRDARASRSRGSTRCDCATASSAARRRCSRRRPGVAQADASERQSRAALARFEEVHRLSRARCRRPTELDAARAEHDRAVADQAGGASAGRLGRGAGLVGPREPGEGDHPLAGHRRGAGAPGRSRPDRRRIVQHADAVPDRRGPRAR